jgi:hypothetical protein
MDDFIAGRYTGSDFRIEFLKSLPVNLPGFPELLC